MGATLVFLHFSSLSTPEKAIYKTSMGIYRTRKKSTIFLNPKLLERIIPAMEPRIAPTSTTMFPIADTTSLIGPIWY